MILIKETNELRTGIINKQKETPQTKKKQISWESNPHLLTFTSYPFI